MEHEGDRVKIKLELQDYAFATTQSPFGTYRWLVVRVGGKDFAVSKSLGEYSSPAKEEWINQTLAAQMEAMLGKILADACGAIPEGTDLTPTGVQG